MIKITPNYLLYSSEFWKTAFQNQQNRKKFIFNTLNRIPKFFSNSAENSAVGIIKIGYINYIYQAGYSFIHKKIWGFVFLGFIITLYPFFNVREHNQGALPASFLPFFYIVIFSAIGLTIFTYKDSNFLRMRSAVEPIILFFIFTSISQLIKTVYMSMKTLSK